MGPLHIEGICSQKLWRYTEFAGVVNVLTIKPFHTDQNGVIKNIAVVMSAVVKKADCKCKLTDIHSLYSKVIQASL